MNNGTVNFFNSERGFGYIKQEGNASEIHVHLSALKRAGIKGLIKGQMVKFDTHADPDSGKITVNHIEVD